MTYLEIVCIHVMFQILKAEGGGSGEGSKKIWIPKLGELFHLKGFQKWVFEEHWEWLIREKRELHCCKTEFRVSEVEIVGDAKYPRELFRTEVEKVLLDLLIDRYWDYLGSISVEQWSEKQNDKARHQSQGSVDALEILKSVSHDGIYRKGITASWKLFLERWSAKAYSSETF